MSRAMRKKHTRRERAMREWLGLLSIAAATLIFGSASAAATCAPEDLAGRWDSYALGDVGGEAFWERCGIRFDESGEILAGSACLDDFNDRSTLSGRWILGSNCRITGTLTPQYPGVASAECSIAQATLAPDKGSVTGVGRCADVGSIFSFTLVRR
jgi:hypothetical protein